MEAELSPKDGRIFRKDMVDVNVHASTVTVKSGAVIMSKH